MKMHYEIFRSTMKNYENMCAEVSEFCTGIGQQSLVNVTHARDSGGDKIIIVWYWD